MDRPSGRRPRDGCGWLNARIPRSVGGISKYSFYYASCMKLEYSISNMANIYLNTQAIDLRVRVLTRLNGQRYVCVFLSYMYVLENS